MKYSLKAAALQLNPDQLQEGYFSLTLPSRLKQVLLADFACDRLQKNKHPIGLPGIQFKALVNASLPDIVYIDGSFPTDRPFLFSLEAIPERRIKTLLKCWIRETFKLKKKRGNKDPVEQDITTSLTAIDQTLLQWHQHTLSSEDWELSSNGTGRPLNSALFGVIPSIAVSRITQAELCFPEFASQFQSLKFLPALEVASSFHQKPQFCITDVFYSKKDNPYAFMIHPRLLQIPGQPQLYLPLDFGVRRYLTEPYKRKKLPESFSVMVYTRNGACTAKISENRYWENNLAELLSKFDYDSVPTANDLLLNPLGWSDPDLKLRFFILNREGREKFQDVTAGVTPNDLVHLFNVVSPTLQLGFEPFEPKIVDEGTPKFAKFNKNAVCPDLIHYVDFNGVGTILEREAEKLQLNLVKEEHPGLVAMCDPIAITPNNNWKQRNKDRDYAIEQRVQTLPERYSKAKALILPIYPEAHFKQRPQEDPYEPIQELLPERNLLIKRLNISIDDRDEKELSHKCKATLLALKCRLGYHDGLIPEALKAYGLPSDLQTIGIYLHRLANKRYVPIAIKLDAQGLLTGRTAISSVWRPLGEFIPFLQAATDIAGCKRGGTLRKLTSSFFKSLTDSPKSTLILPYASNLRQALPGLKDPHFGAEETIFLVDGNDKLLPFSLPDNCRIIRCRDGGDLPQATLWDNEEHRPSRGRAIAQIASNSYLLIRSKAATDQTNSQQSMLRPYENKSGKVVPPGSGTTAKKIVLVEANPLLKPNDGPLDWLSYLQYLQRIAPQYDNFLHLPLVLHIPATFF